MTQNEVDALDNQRKALELRKAGVSYQRIAESLGYKDASGAWRAVKAALKKTLQEPSDDLRRLEVERLDAALSAVWASVMKGQYGAVDRFLRIQERRARLLGLDAPAKLDLNNKGVQKVIIEYVDSQNTATPPSQSTDTNKE